MLELQLKFRLFDRNKTGAGESLSKSELASYLRQLNGGKEVLEEEVNTVMEEADILKDGEIGNITELLMATSR